MKEYNKLIRDKIPEIIEAAGKQCIVEVMNEEEYLEALDAKLNEELAEYQADKSLEELADLLEVMYAVVRARGYTTEKLERVRKQKAEKRGGFEKRLRLKGVIESGSEEI
ncbi:MAG TPA: nucleoside triphosphate pyrophosphohydrolase [Ruminococcus flavefaciens]|nr:nucleoside triphosphate pyrophosphohydrolase [Ruminococcus flavefaciens]HQM01015.1 nucleoside triphosphate pyrophosphohydrolase [Ruminococcus flavefaciens]